MPLISVIVPVYKVEPYLHQCVDSILNQTFKDFELILVDDGSPDNCPAICDVYAKQDSRVIVIHKENGGLSSARNAGLDYVFANSDSEYISFVDSDDWVESNFLFELYMAIDGCELSLCMYYFCKNGEIIQAVERVNQSLLDKNSYWMVDNNGIFNVVAWNKLYKKDIFSDIRYPVGKNHEDEFVIHRIIGKCKNIRMISSKLYNYRLRNDSITGKEEKTSLSYKQFLLDLYIDRAFYYFDQNNDFLDYYGKAFKILVSVYNLNKKIFTSEYKRLKKLYYSKKKTGYRPSKSEILFFLSASMYYCLKKYASH